MLLTVGLHRSGMARGGHQKSPARELAGPSDYLEASSIGVSALKSPLLPRLESKATRRNPSSASYLPVWIEHVHGLWELDLPEIVGRLGPCAVGQVGTGPLRDLGEHRQLIAEVLHRQPHLHDLPSGPGFSWSGPMTCWPLPAW